MADPPVPATDQVPLFDFMVVRAPAAVDPAAARRNFINNSSLSMEKDVVTEPEVEIWAGSSSAVTALIYRKVFCTDPLPEDPMADLLTGLLTLVPGRPLSCAGGVATHGETPGTVRLDELERHAWIQRGDLYHVLFDSLDQLAHVPLAGRLPAVLAAIDEVVAGTGQFDGRRLRERIEGCTTGSRCPRWCSGRQATRPSSCWRNGPCSRRSTSGTCCSGGPTSSWARSSTACRPCT